MADAQWVYHTDDHEALRRVAPDGNSLRALLGRAGAGVSELMRRGVPMPFGFSVTTAACRAYWAAGQRWPPHLREQLQGAVDVLQNKTGKHLGDSKNPLLLWAAVGSRYPCPGLMDNFRCIGLTDGTSLGLINLTGDAAYVYDRYYALSEDLGCIGFAMPYETFEGVECSVLTDRGVARRYDLDTAGWRELIERTRAAIQDFSGGLLPLDPRQQLELAVEKVFASWMNPRAVAFRNAHGVPDDPPLAVHVSTVVLSNLGEDSAIGWVQTRDKKTGERCLAGYYALNYPDMAPLDSPRPTSYPIDQLPPALYGELTNAAQIMERYYREPRDIVFVIERGKLWMTGGLPSQLSPAAAARVAADMAEKDRGRL